MALLSSSWHCCMSVITTVWSCLATFTLTFCLSAFLAVLDPFKAAKGFLFCFLVYFFFLRKDNPVFPVLFLARFAPHLCFQLSSKHSDQQNHRPHTWLKWPFICTVWVLILNLANQSRNFLLGHFLFKQPLVSFLSVDFSWANSEKCIKKKSVTEKCIKQLTIQRKVQISMPWVAMHVFLRWDFLQLWREGSLPKPQVKASVTEFLLALCAHLPYVWAIKKGHHVKRLLPDQRKMTPLAPRLSPR